MSLQYVRFQEDRRVEQYVGQPGSEVGNLALPAFVYEAIAESKVKDLPAPYVVRGEWRGSDGRRYLDVRITREHIEATTNYRQDPRGQLRWTCPQCLKFGGQHAKSCDYES